MLLRTTLIYVYVKINPGSSLPRSLQNDGGLGLRAVTRSNDRVAAKGGAAA